MDLHAFLKVADPRKVKVVVAQKEDDEPRLLDSIVRRTVPLLPVTVVTSSVAIVADIEKMFDEGCSDSRNQADYVQTDSKEKEGYSRRLLKNVVLNAEVGVQALSTLPIMTSSITPSPPKECEDHTDFVNRPNLQTIGPSERYVISSDSSLHSTTNVVEAEVDSLVRSPIISVMTTATVVSSVAASLATEKEKFVAFIAAEKERFVGGFSAFATFGSSEGRGCSLSVISGLSGSGFDMGDILTVVGVDTDLQKLFDEFIVLAARHVGLSVEVRMRAEHNIQKKQKLKSTIKDQDELLKTKDNEIDTLKAQRLLKEATATEAIRLLTQTFAFESLEKSFRDEVNILKERNHVLKKERNALDVKVTNLESSVVEKDRKLADLDVAAVSAKSHNDSLIDKVHELETSSSALQEKMDAYDGLLDRVEEFQNKLIGKMEEKLASVEDDYIKCCLRLEEKFYPSLLVGIAGRRWLLTHGMKLLTVKCLNSSEYMTALGQAVSRAIERGMQEVLAARIDHGKAGRDLADLEAYNPVAALDFDVAVKELRELNFPILAELSFAKDASIMDVMNILRLDDSVSEALGLTDFHPYENQLMVRKMKENLAEHWHILKDVFVPVEYLLSVEALTAIPGTPDEVSAIASTTTALSTLFHPVSSAPSLSMEDYNVEGADDDGKVQVGSSLFQILRRKLKKLFCEAGDISSVSSFDQTIHLWVFHRGKGLLDGQFFAPILEGIVSKLLAIIRFDLSWEDKSAYYVLPYEFLYMIARNSCYGFGFNPLGEVINGDNKKLDFAGTF
uniref:Transposase (Putative), gypsy type n=1 Tax=Tanacetum cinerariifolium TaxID=118510 RepID=A0A6L2N1V9_TANCI|nr:hypothetical protein [Tanacetum cinerariifolium]